MKVLKALRGSRAGKSLLTLTALGAIASVGVLGTQAAFTDQVTMAQISVTGGALDMKANNGDGPNQAWAGSLAVALTGLKPGDEQSGTVVVKHGAGSTVPFRLTTTTTGADASGCYNFYFRETAAVGATKSATFPVNFTGMGTAVGSDASTAPFATGITGMQLPDNGADLDFETDDEKTYTLTVRMKTACTTNGAAGTLNFTFNATQA